MNYKEKFEDFLDRMTGLLDEANKKGHIIVRVEDLENAFPKLKESKDERIRKAIIEMIHDTPSIECEYNYNVSKEDALVWLEKQDEKKSSDEILKIRQEVYQSGYNDGYKHGFKDAKQVKKPQGKSALEVIKEEKVEPKFKVGN